MFFGFSMGKFSASFRYGASKLLIRAYMTYLFGFKLEGSHFSELSTRAS